MKILITTDVYNTIVNGVAVSVDNLYRSLRESGNDVRILTLAQTPFSYYEKNVYYIRSSSIKIYPDARATLSFWDDLLEEIIEWEPDIIHSQCEFFTFVFAKKLSKRLHIPIVHTYHTLYEYYTHYFCPSKNIGKKIVKTLSKFICNQADMVIAPTKKTADILKGYEVDSEIAIVPTGISLERLRRTVEKEEREELKAKLRIPEGVPVLVTLGRLAKEKNVEFLIRQMARPQIRALEIHFLIVGDGPDRERLEFLVKELGLEEVVHFAGIVSPEEVYKYYRLGDIFVSASQSETQGLTYIEAMTCELPLLCFKDECLQNVLYSGWNGYFFENEEEFMERLISCFKEREMLSLHASETAEEFSRETFGVRVLQIYMKMVEERKEEERCIQYECIPRPIWPKGMGC